MLFPPTYSEELTLSQRKGTLLLIPSLCWRVDKEEVPPNGRKMEFPSHLILRLTLGFLLVSGGCPWLSLDGVQSPFSQKGKIPAACPGRQLSLGVLLGCPARAFLFQKMHLNHLCCFPPPSPYFFPPEAYCSVCAVLNFLSSWEISTVPGG